MIGGELHRPPTSRPAPVVGWLTHLEERAMLTLPIRHRRPDAKLESLRRLSSLDVLPEAELLRFAALAELVDVDAGTVLTREGVPAQEAFLVVSGSLAAVRGELTVTTVGAGQLAGDVALLDREPRATGLVATAPSELAVLTRSGLQRLTHTSPWFIDLLLGQLATRVRRGVPT